MIRNSAWERKLIFFFLFFFLFGHGGGNFWTRKKQFYRSIKPPTQLATLTGRVIIVLFPQNRPPKSFKKPFSGVLKFNNYNYLVRTIFFEKFGILKSNKYLTDFGVVKFFSSLLLD